MSEITLTVLPTNEEIVAGPIGASHVILQVGRAATSEANALAYMNAAAISAQLASDKADIATTQAGIATTKAGIATTKAGIATTKAVEANTSAIIATLSETNAANSASAAASSAATAQSAAEALTAIGLSVVEGKLCMTFEE